MWQLGFLLLPWCDTSARLSVALAGTGDAWVCMGVKGTGWLIQMLRALWHDLQQGKKRLIWLPYKQPQIPLTSAGVVPPFCRAEFDFKSLEFNANHLYMHNPPLNYKQPCAGVAQRL